MTSNYEDGERRCSEGLFPDPVDEAPRRAGARLRSVNYSLTLSGSDARQERGGFASSRGRERGVSLFVSLSSFLSDVIKGLFNCLIVLGRDIEVSITRHDNKDNLYIEFLKLYVYRIG